jgi:hypothetical protein
LNDGLIYQIGQLNKLNDVPNDLRNRFKRLNNHLIQLNDGSKDQDRQFNVLNRWYESQNSRLNQLNDDSKDQDCQFNVLNR